MYIPKRYGQSKIEGCPFCNKRAVVHNSQRIPVCTLHKDEKITDIKCVCGEWLDLKTGKWGPYFHCMRCGNINFKRALEMAPLKDTRKTEIVSNKANPEKRETVIRSDELDLY